MEKRKFSIRKFLKGFLPTFIGGAIVLTLLAAKTDALTERIPVNLKERQGIKRIEVPAYNLLRLPPGRCSGYVRRAAEDLFNLNYSLADAWDRRYEDRLVARVSSNDELREMAKRGKLRPGAIVGFYYPRSSHLNEEDMHGNKVTYTHVGLYLGLSPGNEPIFAEQLGRETNVIPLEQLTKRDLRAMEIIEPKD